MLDVQFGFATDSGNVRTRNEDAVASFIPMSRHQARSHGYLFALADGVGGLDLGEVAATTAVATVVQEFGAAQADTMLNSLLPRLVQHANAAVHDCTLSRESRGKKMATTIVACALRYNQAFVSHVGDSRCYLIRNGVARQITQDHTLVNEQRKMGLISVEETGASDFRHVLLRSLGPEKFVSPDTISISILPGDTLVLCSDGVHDELSSREMALIASQKKKPAEEIAREIVARAVELDGKDNTTAQVIRVLSVEQKGMGQGRSYRLPA